MRIGDSVFEPWLAAIAVFGIAGSIAWLKRLRNWRVLVIAAGVSYLVHYATHLYAFDVAPLLAIMSLPQAVSDAFYVLWSSPMGRLSRGEVLDAAAELWRECFMPLVQVGVLLAALRR